MFEVRKPVSAGSAACCGKQSRGEKKRGLLRTQSTNPVPLQDRGAASGSEATDKVGRSLMNVWRWLWQWLTGQSLPDSEPQSEGGNRLRSQPIGRVGHAHDITFLGRGVSQGLADRRSDVKKLRRLGLPVLSSPADLARALGVSLPRLRWLTYHSEAALVDHYVRFTIPKKGGGQRELAMPLRQLRACQEWIRAELLARLPVHPAAHGFVAGRSIVTNAQPHARARVIVNVDLEDFFPSITFPRVRGWWISVGYSPAVATLLALLCTDSPRQKMLVADCTCHVAQGPRSLPQGACTSPALSNLMARRLDARLAGLARRLGWVYTRYADDITFSCPDVSSSARDNTARENDPGLLVGYLLARIRHIVEAEGFRLNPSKTRVLRRHTAQVVTGLVVNDGVHVPRRWRRKLRALLHQAAHTGLAAQNRLQHPAFAQYVRGQVAFVSMVQPQEGQRLKDTLLSLLETERG